MLTKLYVRFTAWAHSEEGATAVEYGIMVAGIAVVILVIVFALGDQIKAMFTQVSSWIGGHPRTP